MNEIEKDKLLRLCALHFPEPSERLTVQRQGSFWVFQADDRPLLDFIAELSDGVRYGRLVWARANEPVGVREAA